MGRTDQKSGSAAPLGRTMAVLALPLVVSACAPVPVETAERQCYTQYAPKAPISGEGRMGATTDGAYTKMELQLNLGGTAQGDASAAYDACVYRKSGRMPTRPLYSY
ncbi:hypothetical protein [Thioclava sp.]|uniref:hypothetical protein n=1 Tax=Thioclava sp. TaxID=1933450 RepID=UPI003AA99D50